MRRKLALLVSALLVTSCAGDDGAEVLLMWALGREGEVVQQMVPEFERRNPGLRVHVQQIPWSAAHEKLLTAYVGESLPDVVQLGNTWIPELVTVGALATLDDRIAASVAVRREDHFPGIWETNVIDARVYGIPWYADTRLLFYRSDLVREAGGDPPPATWSGWIEVMARLRRTHGGERFPIFLPVREWAPLVAIALEHGATLLRDGDRFGDFRNPAFRRALELYFDLFRRDLASRRAEAQVANLYQDFAAGDFALFISGPWSIGELRRRLPAGLQASWTTAPLPSDEPNRPGVSLAGGSSLALVRGSTRSAAGWKLIEYLSEPERQLELYRLSGDLPANRRAWEDPLLRADREATAFLRQLQHVRATPRIPEWERIAAKIGEYVEAVVQERIPIDAALRGLDGEVDAILEKRRWVLARAGRSRP